MCPAVVGRGQKRLGAGIASAASKVCYQESAHAATNPSAQVMQG